jgi:hypothetical protein
MTQTDIFIVLHPFKTKVGIMRKVYVQHHSKIQSLAFITALIVVIITASLAFGHGGKHSDKFTQLQALQKATKLLDQLVTKGKLDQNWETGLENVAISKRKNNGKDEVVVSFQRQEGDPKAVYIFFDSNGKYTGSNFSGE